MLKYSDYIYPVSFAYDQQLLLSESMNDGYETYFDPLCKVFIKGWMIKKITEGYGMTWCQNFARFIESNDCRPRFYILEPGHKINFHKDRGTQCSLNIILSDGSDPISFRDFDYSYKIALLNTQQEHAVISPKTQRRLFKVSVFDKTFNEVSEILESKLLNSTDFNISI